MGYKLVSVINISKRRWNVIGIGEDVLSQCKGWSFQNFPLDANNKTNNPRIVKVSMSMSGQAKIGWQEAF